MELTNEQERQIKDQLLSQIKQLPSEQQEQAQKQIQAMSKEEIVEFIKKNQQLQENGEQGNKCIFCGIVNGTTPSIKIDENEKAIAVMDINPISQGHVLIVPKKHDSEPDQKSQELAFTVGDRILKTLQPKDITTRGAKIMDHTILNVIPIYDDTDFEKRIQTSQDELVETANKISEILQEKKTKKVEESVTKPQEPVCVFCSIINKHTKSYTIDENKDCVAILEINPVSKGHCIIIPKIHTNTTNLPTSAFTLAKKIAKKIATKYKPNDVKINPTSINNHGLIEVIPLYDDTDPSKREKLSSQILQDIQKNLEKKERKKSSVSKTTKKATKKSTKKKIALPKSKYPHLPQLPPRIP